jgi:uncharacterized protein YggE
MRPSPHFLGIAAAGVSFATLAQPALAQGAPAPERTITVSGDGEAKAPPDEAHLSAGVVTSARKAGDALAANTRAMNAVFATLKRFGIPDTAIQTSDFSVAPQYANDRQGNSTPQIAGYQVSNDVNVTVDLAQLGAALDALVGSGANSLGSLDFAIRDPQPLMARARAEAMKDAAARAETYAAAGGFTLGPILAVNESGTETPQPIMARPMMRMAAAPVPVASGENTVSASVSVTYEIR